MKGTGNQQDYGMRIYDPRLGRFLSVDPITQKYPELTPYQFASNSPIAGVDQDGLEFSINLPVMPTIAVLKVVTATGKYLAVQSFKAGFSNYLPKELIDHYAGGTGKPFHLNEQKMKDINPTKIGIQGLIPKDQQEFTDKLASLKQGESTILKDWNVLDGSGTSGGLGGFTVTFNGTLTKDGKDASKWKFVGTMDFKDNWNFNSHAKAVSNGETDYRSESGDQVTTLARKYLPGKPFDVNSDKVNVTQTSDDNFVDWFNNFTPVSIPNRVYEHPDLMKGVKKDGKP